VTFNFWPLSHRYKLPFILLEDTIYAFHTIHFAIFISGVFILKNIIVSRRKKPCNASSPLYYHVQLLKTINE